MEFFVCFDEFYKMAKKHDGVKKIVVHFFLKSVNRTKTTNCCTGHSPTKKIMNHFRIVWVIGNFSNRCGVGSKGSV